MSTIDEIKERLDIVEIIGGYIPLQKAGRNYKALCPFHNEKTPSFYVFPDRGSWHCFGACSTGGDVIRFVEKKENLDFRSALELLARRAGVDLDRERDPEAATRLNRLREIHTLAAGFYQHQLLHTPAGAAARAYLEKRALDAATIESFQIGYAPPSWDALLSYLDARGYQPADLETAGLVIRRDDGGHHDRFRQRVMIPIRDAQSRIIGFGGRILDAGEPKYLNSPQTPLFDKSSTIFALDLARRSLLAANQAVIVEGYMDVISAHQRGFTNVVAAMGTAITAQHLQRLSRYTRRFVFALDADAAGLSATLRSLEVARAALANSAPVPTPRGLRYETRLDADIKIAAMPPGQDPDDVLRADPEQWRSLIDAAEPLLDYLFGQAARSADLKTAHGKAQFVKGLLPIVSEIADPVERRHYVSRLAMLAGVTEREIDQELETYARQRRRARPAEQQQAPTPAPPSLRDDSDIIAGSTTTEEPPLWLDEASTSAPVKSQPPAASEPQNLLELHILAHLLARRSLLAWVDAELAGLRFDPISADDFQETANQAIFDAQQEFLYSDGALLSGDVGDPWQRLDPLLRAYAATLQRLLQQLDALRDDQRRKDLLDSILRLRLRRWQRTCHDLELLLRTAEADEVHRAELGAQLVQATRQQKAVAKALHARSHTSRWTNGNSR